MAEKFKPSPEKGKLKEPLPVTGEELVKIFESRKFQELARKSAKSVHRSGYEAGFAVLRDAYRPSRIFYTEVALAEEISTSVNVNRARTKVSEEIEEKKGSFAIELIELHLHPDILGSEPIIPSLDAAEQKGDLMSLTMGKFNLPRMFGPSPKISLFPIEMIGQVDQQGNCRFLFVQEQFNKYLSQLPATMELLEQELDRAETQEDVLKALRENGYRTEIINVSNKGQISDEDKAKIERFASQPKIVGDWDQELEDLGQ